MVVEVVPFTLVAAREIICAGAVNSAAHKTKLEATLKNSNGTPRAGMTINFAIVDSDAQSPSSLTSPTGVTNAQGVAEVDLISSTLVNATAKVTATIEDLSAETTVTMGAPETPTWALDPEEPVATGATVKITAALKFGPDPVDGHNISWRIIMVKNSANAILFDFYDSTNDDMPAGYGSIAAATPGEAPLGGSISSFVK